MAPLSATRKEGGVFQDDTLQSFVVWMDIGLIGTQCELKGASNDKRRINPESADSGRNGDEFTRAVQRNNTKELVRVG